MTYRPDFSECWAKLERAWQHRDTLNAGILPLISAKRYPITLSAKLDSHSGEYVFWVAGLPEVPLQRLGLVVGDCVHNLRCALDYLVWQLALHKCNGVEPADANKVQFPILTTRPKKMKQPEDFASTGRLKDVLPTHRAIIEGFQPYNSQQGPPFAGHPFATLQQLSNGDKHRLLNKMLAVSREYTFAGSSFEGVWPLAAGSLSTVGNLEVGTEYTRLPLPPGFEDEVELAGYAALDIRLPQGEPVIDGIDRITAHVAKAIREFEPLL